MYAHTNTYASAPSDLSDPLLPLTVCVWAAVGHGHNATLAVLQRVHDLIGKLAIRRRVDAAPPLASARWVACREWGMQHGC